MLHLVSKINSLYLLVSLLPSRLPSWTIARIVSSKLLGFCFFLIFVSVPFVRLSWSSRRFLSARKCRPTSPKKLASRKQRNWHQNEVDEEWRASTARTLNRDKVMKVRRLGSCGNFVGKSRERTTTYIINRPDKLLD